MEKTYRKGIIIIITNKQGEFLLVQLPKYQTSEWSFIGKGNVEEFTFKGLDVVVRNTLQEKLNIAPTDLEVVSVAKDPIQYDFPEVRLKDDGKMYNGQVKTPVVVRFIGDSATIKPLAEKVKAIKWVAYEDLKKYLVFPNQYDQLSLILKSIKYLSNFIKKPEL